MRKSMRRQPGRPLLGVALVLVVGLIACGSSGGEATTTTGSAPTTTGSGAPASTTTTLDLQSATPQEIYAALSSMDAESRSALLVDMANEEGEVVFYSSTTADQTELYQERFVSAFPQIDARMERLATPDLLARVVSESEAGRPVASVLLLPAPEALQLANAGLLASYDSPEAASLIPEYRSAENLWTVQVIQPQVIAFNTDRISREEVPITLQDLGDPVYAGRLGRHANGDRWIGGVFAELGENDALSAIEAIALNQPSIFTSNTELMNAVTAGQVPVAFDINHPNVLEAIAAGAPVDYVTPEPLYVLPLYIMIPVDAPHPWAGALLYDWLLAQDGGQAALMELGRVGPRPDTDYPNGELMKDAQRIIPYSPEVLGDLPRYREIFEELFING